MHATKRPQLLTPQDDHQGAILASDVWIYLPQVERRQKGSREGTLVAAC